MRTNGQLNLPRVCVCVEVFEQRFSRSLESCELFKLGVFLRFENFVFYFSMMRLFKIQDFHTCEAEQIFDGIQINNKSKIFVWLQFKTFR